MKENHRVEIISTPPEKVTILSDTIFLGTLLYISTLSSDITLTPCVHSLQVKNLSQGALCHLL